MHVHVMSCMYMHVICCLPPCMCYYVCHVRHTMHVLHACDVTMQDITCMWCLPPSVYIHVISTGTVGTFDVSYCIYSVSEIEICVYGTCRMAFFPRRPSVYPLFPFIPFTNQTMILYTPNPLLLSPAKDNSINLCLLPVGHSYFLWVIRSNSWLVATEVKLVCIHKFG